MLCVYTPQGFMFDCSPPKSEVNSASLFRAWKRRFDPGSCAAEPQAAKHAVVAVGPVVTEYEVELIVI